MASASKFTSALSASAIAFTVFATVANGQDISAIQSCETASLNNTSLTPPSFAQEDFVAISNQLNGLGLLDGEIIGDLLETRAVDQTQEGILKNFRRQLDILMSPEYAEATTLEDFHPDVLSGFATALEDYLTVLQSIYADNPEVNEAFAVMAPHRAALKNTTAQIAMHTLRERMGLVTCKPSVITDPADKSYGEHAPALAIS